MAATTTTIDDDLLDPICHRYYGQHKGTVEAVLAANPGLAAIPQLMPLESRSSYQTDL